MDEIDIIRKKEEENFQGYVKILKTSYSLIGDIDNLYQSLIDNIKISNTEVSDYTIASTQFILASCYQFTMAALNVLRGHSYDSFYYTRKAIELCAFAARVKKHPHLVKIWINAADDDKSYEKYRDKFSPGKLFSNDHHVLGKLYNRYDRCCKLTHPSLFSIAGHIETIKTDKDVTYNFHYFRSTPDDRIETIRIMIWLCDTHLLILRTFADIFVAAAKHDSFSWMIQYNATAKKLMEENQRWDLVIDDM